MIGLGQVQTCLPGEALEASLGLCAAPQSVQQQPAPTWYCGTFLSDLFGAGPCYPPYVPTPAAGPSTAVQMTVPGAWTPGQAIAATIAQQQSGAQQLFGTVASSNKSVSLLPSLPSIDPSAWSWQTWALIIGGVLAISWVANRTEFIL